MKFKPIWVFILLSATILSFQNCSEKNNGTPGAENLLELGQTFDSLKRSNEESFHYVVVGHKSQNPSSLFVYGEDLYFVDTHKNDSKKETRYLYKYRLEEEKIELLMDLSDYAISRDNFGSYLGLNTIRGINMSPEGDKIFFQTIEVPSNRHRLLVTDLNNRAGVDLAYSFKIDEEKSLMETYNDQFESLKRVSPNLSIDDIQNLNLLGDNLDTYQNPEIRDEVLKYFGDTEIYLFNSIFHPQNNTIYFSAYLGVGQTRGGIFSYSLNNKKINVVVEYTEEEMSGMSLWYFLTKNSLVTGNRPKSKITIIDLEEKEPNLEFDFDRKESLSECQLVNTRNPRDFYLSCGHDIFVFYLDIKVMKSINIFFK